MENIAYPVEVVFDVRCIRTRIPVLIVAVFAVVRMGMHIGNAVPDTCDNGAVVDDARTLEIIEDDITNLQFGRRCHLLCCKSHSGGFQIPSKAV